MESNNHSTNTRSSDHSSDQSINQSISQSINQSTPLPPSQSNFNTLLNRQRVLENELMSMKVRREHATGDDAGRNPIAPCGACTEWLKKIAEVMPDFKVVTFTSTQCDTVFVKSVNR